MGFLSGGVMSIISNRMGWVVVSVAVIGACLVFRAAADDEAVSLSAAPPVVVKAVPQAGTDDVDPAVKEIRVTYSKDMADGTWSWSTWGDGHVPGDDRQ